VKSAALMPIGRHDSNLSIDFASYLGCPRMFIRNVRNDRSARISHTYASDDMEGRSRRVGVIGSPSIRFAA